MFLNIYVRNSKMNFKLKLSLEQTQVGGQSDFRVSRCHPQPPRPWPHQWMRQVKTRVDIINYFMMIAIWNDIRENDNDKGKDNNKSKGDDSKYSNASKRMI